MAKRADEEFCKDVFSSFLQRFLSADLIRWDPVAPSEEPPDYFLEIGPRRFAVEVTSCVDEVQVGSRNLTTVGVNASLVDFCRQLKVRALSESALSGSYLLIMDPVSDLKNKQSSIFEAALEYFRSTSSLPTASEKILVREGDETISIVKLGDHTDGLEPATCMPGKWEGEMIEDVDRMLSEALVAKRKKLKAISEPKILLLLDRYHFGDSTDWVNAAESCNFAEFHTVAIVRQDKSMSVLHTDDAVWA